MRASFVLLIGFFEVLFLLVTVPGSVQAAMSTVVTADIHSDTFWTAEGSPYILDNDVHVDTGAELHIGSGVKVTARGALPASLVIHGSLFAEGSSSLPIEIVGLGGIIVDSGRASIAYAYIHDTFGLHGLHGDIEVASTTFSAVNGTAIRMDGGSLRGSNLRIQDSSTYGVLASAFAPPSKPDDVPDIQLHQSSFANNTLGSVYNTYSDTIHLEENWWGSAEGPLRSGTNSVRGPIEYEPFLDHDPTDMTLRHTAECCSSVLFIPGLEGTRLYDGSHTLMWEPVGNANILKLHLDLTGSSTQRVIAGEPIDLALGIKGIYGKFMNFMNDLVSAGSIHEWKSFGYDWRYLADRTVADKQDRGTTTQSIIDEVLGLAARSLTGKVALVAHSNGGLVAKALVKELSDSGRADIIDAVISVAVPYLGAPEAIAGLLHGDHQSIAGGFFASKTSMRDLALNMPSAYGLLPSAIYFLKSLGPTVVFASTTIPGLTDGSYSDTVTNSLDQRNFIVDTADLRTIPATSNVNSASIGNATLLSMADALHATLDVFEWPASIVRWALLGWNRDTTTAVEYHMRPGCDGLFGKVWCKTTQYFHRLATSLLGDGTVPVMSALFGSDRIFVLDLDAISHSEDMNFSHANILESSTTQDIIRKIVTTPRRKTVSVGEIQNVAPRPPFEVGDPMIIRVTLNGDASITVKDEQGTDVSTGHTVTTGSGDGTYSEVTLPYGYGHVYSVIVHGGGYGFFTLGVERMLPRQPADRAQYVTEPLSPVSVASTTINTAMMEEAEDSIATILPVLSVDVDGDGRPEYAATPDGNGLPGNATTTEEADRIAREQSVEVIMKTDTPELRGDPKRLEFISDLFPAGTNGPQQTPTTSPTTSDQQKTPPVSGSASCPSQ